MQKQFVKARSLRPNTYFLIAILILAIALRVNHIDQPYVDVFSWRQTSTAMMADNYFRTNWNIFFPEVSWGGPGPNYQGREFQTVSYLSALLYTVFGKQDWVGRLVATTFGVWGVFALYQLVRRVWNEERALASALIMAIIPGGVFTERSFLPDPAMTALMTTSCWLLVAHLQTGSTRYLLFAALIFTWGALSKITGLMVGIPLLYALFAILHQKQELKPKRLSAIALAGTLSLIPVVIYYLWAKYLANNYPPYHFAGSANWIWVQGFSRWFEESYFFPDFFSSAYYWLWTWPILVLLLIGLVVSLTSKRFTTQLAPSPQQLSNSVSKDIPFNSRHLDNANSKDIAPKAPWFFHWWLVSAGFFYLIGARELVDNPWNFHIFNPVVAAFAGYGMLATGQFVAAIIPPFLQQYAPPKSTQKIVFIATITVILLTIASVSHVRLKDMYSRSWGEESYELGLLLRQISEPKDLVVTMSSDLGDPNIIYYSQRRGWTFPSANNDIDWSVFPEDENYSIEMFEDLRSRGADWLAIAATHQQELQDEHPKLLKHIETHCQIQAQRKFGSICKIASSTSEVE